MSHPTCLVLIYSLEEDSFHKTSFFTVVLISVITDSTSSLQENFYQAGQEVTQNLILPNDHIVHVATDLDKTGFRTNNGDSDCITWQPKQGDMETSNVLQKSFNSGVASRSSKNSSDGRDNRMHNREYS
jgi:hypothetical protein